MGYKKCPGCPLRVTNTAVGMAGCPPYHSVFIEGVHCTCTVYNCAVVHCLSLSFLLFSLSFAGSRSGFQSHSHTNYAPRVINHAPLRDQKGWKGEGGRGGDRERGKSGWYKGREIEVHTSVLVLLCENNCKDVSHLTFSLPSPPPPPLLPPILLQEEPEWMAFGPSDRSEVIELVGFEEHEKGREVGEKTWCYCVRACVCSVCVCAHVCICSRVGHV